MTDMIIPTRIRETRRQRGISAKVLASRLDMSEPALRRLENGKTKLSLDIFEAICAALSVTPGELNPKFGGTGEASVSIADDGDVLVDQGDGTVAKHAPLAGLVAPLPPIRIYEEPGLTSTGAWSLGRSTYQTERPPQVTDTSDNIFGWRPLLGDVAKVPGNLWIISKQPPFDGGHFAVVTKQQPTIFQHLHTDHVNADDCHFVGTLVAIFFN